MRRFTISFTISSTNVPLHTLITSSHSVSVDPSAVNYGQLQPGLLLSFEPEVSLVVVLFQSADQIFHRALKTHLFNIAFT